MRNKIIDAIKKEKIIVIVRNVCKEKLLPLTEAMYQGGIRLLEVTYSANGAVSDAETAENIAMLSSAVGDKMFIGAGSVLKPEQVLLTKNAGGTFIISPDTNDAVIQKTREEGLVSIPGALTPTEIQNAYLYGADFVKLFPIAAFGPDYVKAVSAPLSHVKFLAVGGIDETNMQSYLDVGVYGFGIATNIVNKKMLEEDNYAGIARLAEKFVKAVNA